MNLKHFTMTSSLIPLVRELLDLDDAISARLSEMNKNVKWDIALHHKQLDRRKEIRIELRAIIEGPE